MQNTAMETYPVPDFRRVSLADVQPLRQRLLRPAMRAEEIVLPGDDDASTCHIGMYVEDVLSGIASLYQAPSPHRPECSRAWQMRMIGVVPEQQGRGYARALVLHCIDLLQGCDAELLWGNARMHVAGLYQKLGFVRVGEPFDIPGVCMHILMERQLVALNEPRLETRRET